jgi:dienelactone hydrolase
MKKLLGLIFLALSFFGQMANAQDIVERANMFYKFVYRAHDFKFQLEDSFGAFTNVSNKVLKPQGDGPFPAVVLIHTSGGLRNSHVKRDAQKLVEKGYVALVLDSMGPRNVNVITESTRALYPPAGVKDAYIALDFLKKQSYVDKDRIYEAGYSWGGFVATLLGSPMLAKAAGATDRFKASVSFYSTCVVNKSNLILADTDKPVLMLIAGDDRENPHGTCLQDLDAYRAKGMPIESIVYEKASHGWDKMGESQFGYIYNEEVTNDAFGKMIAFFEKNK